MTTALTKPSKWKEDVCDILHILIILLSLVLVVSISADTFDNLSFLTEGVYLKIQLWICIFFLCDFFFELFISDNKVEYFKKHFIFLIISIPYLNITTHFHLSTAPELSYLLRFMPLIRGGYAMALVVSWFTTNKVSSMLFSYIIFLLTTVYLASLFFFVLENHVNPQVNDYGDSLWWAFMNVTTVGANIYAVTPIGKVLTILLAGLGMMLFPVFTVYLTNLIQMANKKKKATKNQE